MEEKIWPDSVTKRLDALEKSFMHLDAHITARREVERLEEEKAEKLEEKLVGLQFQAWLAEDGGQVYRGEPFADRAQAAFDKIIRYRKLSDGGVAALNNEVARLQHTIGEICYLVDSYSGSLLKDENIVVRVRAAFLENTCGCQCHK